MMGVEVRSESVLLPCLDDCDVQIRKSCEVTVNEFERRYHNRVWNYGDLNSIACEQLFDEACTYRIAPDNFKAIQPYLLAGLDASFAKNVQVGDLMLGGENFGVESYYNMQLSV